MENSKPENAENLDFSGPRANNGLKMGEVGLSVGMSSKGGGCG